MRQSKQPPPDSAWIEAIEPIPKALQVPWAFRRLPVLPTAAVRIIELLDDETSSLTDVVAAFKRSPEITASILRLANSAAFGIERSVETLERAVSVVGSDRARQLAVEHSINGILWKMSFRPSLIACWHECIGTAVIAKALAPLFGLSPERSYTEGLLHDIGSLALCATHPQSYVELLELVRHQNLDLLEGERDFFDIDHCEAGAYLVRRWGLPEGLEEINRLHHGPDISQKNHLTLIRASCRLATIMLDANQTAEEQRAAVASVVSQLPIDDPWAGVEIALGADSTIAECIT